MWTWLKSLWSKIVGKGKKKVEQKVDDLGDSTGTATGSGTTATNTTSDGVAAPADSSEATEGFSNSIAITDKITFSKATFGNVYFTGAKRDWPEENGDCNGEARICWKQGGSWGKPVKFDHVRANTTSRDFINIHGGYGGIVEPPAGTRTAMILVNYKGTKRTNAIFWDWK